MNTSKLEVNKFDKGKVRQEEFFPVIDGTYSNTIPIAEKYFKRAEQLAFDNEFSAHVVFGLIKCDQAKNLDQSAWGYIIYASPMFEQLATTYTVTKYADEVRTYCKYYNFY
jgi:hypothetical protein